MTTTQTKLHTADELLRLSSEGVRGELIRGVLCETMPADGEHGEVVNPNIRVVDVHHRDESTVNLTEDDVLDGGAVLPGFSCAVRDIFDL